MRKGYVQMHRAAIDVAIAMERRRHGGPRPQTAQGAVADICVELDKSRGEIPASSRYWARRWGWHHEEAARLIKRLTTDAGWIILGNSLFPHKRGECDSVVTERDADVLGESTGHAGCEANCDANVPRMCRDCDDGAADVPEKSFDHAGYEEICDTKVSPLPSSTSLRFLKIKTPPPPTPTEPGEQEEVDEYIQRETDRATIAGEIRKSRVQYAAGIRKQINREGGKLTTERRKQLEQWRSPPPWEQEFVRTQKYLKEIYGE